MDTSSKEKIDQLVAEKQYEDALAVYKQALQVDPYDKEAHTGIARTLWQLGRYSESYETYEQITLLDPADEHAWHTFFPGQDDQDKALVEWMKRHSPEEQQVLSQKFTTIADDHCYNDQHEDAVPTYKRALLLNPNNASAYIGLGNSLMALGHTQEGQEAYKHAVQLDPTSTDDFPDVKEIVDETGDGLDGR